jgi:hypothetical protein
MKTLLSLAPKPSGLFEDVAEVEVVLPGNELSSGMMFLGTAEAAIVQDPAP